MIASDLLDVTAKSEMTLELVKLLAWVRGMWGSKADMMVGVTRFYQAINKYEEDKYVFYLKSLYNRPYKKTNLIPILIWPFVYSIYVKYLISYCI